MTTKARIAQLESTLAEVWGVMLLADSVIDDPKVKAAFVKVDEKCRETGLIAKPGMRFVDQPQA